MQNYLEKIEAIGIFNRFDVELTFKPGVNIIYGANGSGKTTLLHIIANALNGDYRRFLCLPFKRIELFISGEKKISLQEEAEYANFERSINLKREDSGKKVRWGIQISDKSNLSKKHKRYTPLMTSAYYPAFRSMIDAWMSKEDYKTTETTGELKVYNREPIHQVISNFSRKLFGDFVPDIKYPSLLDIEQSILDEILKIVITVATEDREVLSKNFLDIFAALSVTDTEDTQADLDNLIQEIEQLSSNIQNYPLLQESTSGISVYTRVSSMLTNLQLDKNNSKQFTKFLRVYRNSLARISDVQKSLLTNINKFINAVNDFLNDKIIEINGEPSIYIKFKDGFSVKGLNALSSGERQILNLIYAATQMSNQDLILIDEPEISLHVDWQRILIRKMAEQLPDKQIIVCTHSLI